MFRRLCSVSWIGWPISAGSSGSARLAVPRWTSVAVSVCWMPAAVSVRRRASSPAWPVRTGEVTAIDLSAAVVAAAAQRDRGSGVHYAVGDITALDFPDGAFARVRSERVLQHLAEPDLAVAELARVTAPGGRVCLIDTDWESFLVEGMPEDLLHELRRLGRE